MTVPSKLITIAQLFKQKRYAYALAATCLALVVGTVAVLAQGKPAPQQPATTQTSQPQVAAETTAADTTVPQTSSTSTTVPSNTQTTKPANAPTKPQATIASVAQTTQPTTTPPTASGTASTNSPTPAPKPVPFGIAGTNTINLPVGGSKQGTLYTTDDSSITWQPGGETTMWMGNAPEKPFAPAFLYLHGTPGYTGNSISFHVETTATATPGTNLQFYVYVITPNNVGTFYTIHVTIQ